MQTLLESAQNPKIKQLLTLIEKPKARRESGLFVVEGIREFTAALAAGFIPQSLFYLPSLHPQPCEHFSLPNGTVCFPVSPALYEKIAYRGSTEGVIAIMQQKVRRLQELTLPADPLIIVTEAVEKPGNIGALLRTADAAQVDAVLVCDPHCDLYNPNLIRASLGAVFGLQVISCHTDEAIAWLQAHEIDIYAATLQDSTPYQEQDYRRACALVVGSEARGLSEAWRQAAKACIRIPMRGALDSLNVSVSAAVLVFEALRQREETR
jgi:rRNA methylases